MYKKNVFAVNGRKEKVKTKIRQSDKQIEFDFPS